MGIESKPAPLLSNQPLTRRLGRNFDTLGDTFGAASVADTLCLHQRPPTPTSSSTYGTKATPNALRVSVVIRPDAFNPCAAWNFRSAALVAASNSPLMAPGS